MHLTEMSYPQIQRMRINEPNNSNLDFGGLNPIIYSEGLILIHHNGFSPGAQALALAQIQYGRTMKFGNVLGLDYAGYAKIPNIQPNLLRPAINEIARIANRQKTDIIIAACNSGTPIACLVGRAMGLPVLEVPKQNANEVWNDEENDGIRVGLPSFTSGHDVVFTAYPQKLEAALAQVNLHNRRPLNFFVVDDIIHAGAVTDALITLVRKIGQFYKIPTQVVGAAALFDMSPYTGAKKFILQKHRVKIGGVLAIRSLGVNPVPWVEYTELRGKALLYSNSY